MASSNKHLETYQQLLEAAFNEGTVSSSLVNRGGRDKELQVSFTVGPEAARRNPALERLIALADQV
jgi:hypothetical protein